MVELGFVCEGPADLRTGSRLADRVLLERVDWLDVEILDDCRAWRGLDGADAFLRWGDVYERARSRGVRALGKFGEEAGLPDARAARLALLLMMSGQPTPDAVVLLRDVDDQPERRSGLEQARRTGLWPFPVVIGAANTKRECWILAGFDPTDDAEGASLTDVRQELGFDPRSRAEELTAKADSARRSAKRVLAILTRGDADRELRCTEADLELLRSRGDATGLREFLEEVATRLPPLFGAH